jgi:cytochrome c oxidase subunit 2
MSTEHLTMAIDGLGCGRCDAPATERALKQVAGVTRVYVNTATEMACIEYDPTVANQADLIGELQIALECIGLTAGESNVRSYETLTYSHIASPQWIGDSQSASDCTWMTTSNTAREAVSADVGSGQTPGATGTCPISRVALLSTGIVTAFAVALFVVSALFVANSGVGASAQYTLDMNAAGFRPAALVIPAGKLTTITVRNTEATSNGGYMNTTMHQFAIDELGLDIKLAPGESRTITLSPMQPGTFHYYCNMCCGGKQNMDMLGALIIH